MSGIYHNNYNAVRTLSKAQCHQECINLSRFDLFSYFSLIHDPVAPTAYWNYDQIDVQNVQIMRRYNYQLAVHEIVPLFRKHFVKLLKSHHENLKRVKKNRVKLTKFLHRLKDQRSNLCVIGQKYTLISASFSQRGSELAKSLKQVAELSKHVTAQRKEINRLRHCLSESSKRYRTLRVKHNKRLRLANLTKSILNSRRKKYLTIKFLKKAAEENGIHLTSAKFTVPGSNEVVSHNFDKGAVDKIVTPELAFQIIDTTHMSMRKYDLMHKILPGILPVPGKIRMFRRKINGIIPVEETRSESTWYAEAGFRVLLANKIDSLFRSGRLSPDVQTIKVKLSGDGTRISRHVGIVTLCFVIIIEGETCQGSTDVCNIVVASCREKSEDLKMAFQNTIEEIETTTEIRVNGALYGLCHFFAADYKFILVVLGMKSAGSNFPCFCCLKPKTEFRNTKLVVEYRTIDKMGTLREGVSENKPLISFIPLDRFIPDHLHLKLRIMDQKFKYVINLVSTLDSTKNTKRKYTTALEMYLKQIGINWIYQIDQKTKTPICGELTMIHIMLKHFDISVACPDLNELKKQYFTQSLCDFRKILTLLRKLYVTESDIKHFNELCDSWYVNAAKMFSKGGFTVYMHLLLEHIGPLIARMGSMYPFANEGVEQYNCIATQKFMHQSNHKTGAPKQIMQASNREIVLSHVSPVPQMPQQKCSNCGNKGHKRKTCLLENTPILMQTATRIIPRSRRLFNRIENNNAL